MVMEAKVNQYITVALISAKRFKNIILEFLPHHLSRKVGYFFSLVLLSFRR